MEAHNAYIDSVLQAAAAPSLAAETVILTLPPLVTAPAGTLIVIEAVLAVQTGAGTTAFTVRIRRGATTAGALVGAAAGISAAAATTYVVPHQVADAVGEIAGQQYVLTAQQTGGTGNGTTNFASIQATWIS